MTTIRRPRLHLAITALVIAAAGAPAQVRYATGQNVVPVFEGWEHNPDGSFDMVFGYMNRNYEEQVDIPVGPDNSIEPGGPDQGQPTHFYRRRQQFVFKVKVPKDWGQKDLVWTLTSRGRTEKAYGSLLPTSELGNLVYQENRGGPADLRFPEEPNQPPSIELAGPAERTITLPETLTLTVRVTDDGHPSARPRRPGATSAAGGVTLGPGRENPVTQAVVKLDPGVRLGVTWILYRGGDAVAFEPMRIPVVDGQATTQVTFKAPGDYRLRVYADDGVLLTPLDVQVKVLPR
ncbi:MAG TPA: hypothetical protein VEV17_01105 [Bryobacteraceae bacterium]|nr:hypothetical protein [Bryobacteraceae bacterium]